MGMGVILMQISYILICLSYWGSKFKILLTKIGWIAKSFQSNLAKYVCQKEL